MSNGTTTDLRAIFAGSAGVGDRGAKMRSGRPKPGAGGNVSEDGRRAGNFDPKLSDMTLTTTLTVAAPLKESVIYCSRKSALALWAERPRWTGQLRVRTGGPEMLDECRQPRSADHSA